MRGRKRKWKEDRKWVRKKRSREKKEKERKWKEDEE